MKIDKNIENLINEEIKKHSKEMSDKLMGRLNEGKKKEKDSDHKKKNQGESKETDMLHKALGVPEGEKIPKSLLNKKKKELISKSYGDKKLSDKDRKLFKQINSALNVSSLKEGKSNKLVVTESELIDLIEEIVNEQKLDKKTPEGLRVTQKAQSESKKENDAHIKATNKKMSDYVGKMYNPNPDKHPKSNGGDRMKYEASEAVDEYIENFAYAAGMENLTYDEIEPDEDWVSDNIKGSSRTGNNPEWANAEETDLSDKINKKRKENLYGQEKAKSYNRVSQPVDTSGSNKKSGKLDDMFKKLESVQSNPVIKEEMDKMFRLLKYNQKTQ